MDFKDLDGSFGYEAEEETRVVRRSSHRKTNNSTVKNRIKVLSVRQWCKIALYLFMAALVIIFIANWEYILSAIYYGFILPLLKFMATTIIVIALIAASVTYIRFRFNR